MLRPRLEKIVRSFAVGGAGGKKIVTFTRQLSILQDAGLPILRSLKILEEQAKPGALKNGLIDVCDEIEGWSLTCPKRWQNPLRSLTGCTST